MAVTDQYSGVVVNQNATAAAAVTTNGQTVYQTFHLPVNYALGTNANEIRYPDLTGVQVMVTIDGSYAQTASLDCTLQSYVIGEGWTTLMTGTTIGSHTDGICWMDIVFNDPVPLDVASLQTPFRIGITPRALSGQPSQVAAAVSGGYLVGSTFVPAVLREGVPFPTSLVNNVPGFLLLKDTVVTYYVQQGVSRIWYATPNPLGAQGQAYVADGVTPLLGANTSASLNFRVLALTADSGEDFLGNEYRSCVIRDTGDDTTTTNNTWVSPPQPSRFAVLSRYFDVRPAPALPPFGLINLIPNPSFEYDTFETAPYGWSIYDPPSNLVSNPSFESASTTGWSTSGDLITSGATLTATTGQRWTGSYGLQVTTPAAAEGVQYPLSQTFVAGTPYTLSLYALPSGATSPNNVAIKLGTATDSVSQTCTLSPDRINLCLNPSAEYDTLATTPASWAAGDPYWTVSTGIAVTASNTKAQVGTKSVKVVSTGTAGAGASAVASGTFRAGTAYTFSVYLAGNAGGEQVTLYAGGSAADFVSSPVTLTTGFQRVSVTWTPSADRTTVYLALKINTAATFFADAALIEASPTLNSYFDGDTQGFGWTGTAGNSTSIDWMRFSVTWVPLTTHATGVSVAVAGLVVGGQSWYIDAVQVTASPAAVKYSDATSVPVTRNAFQVESGWAASGAQSLRSTSTVGIANYPTGVIGPGPSTSGFPVTGGQIYSALATVNILSLPPGSSLAIQLLWYNAAGLLLATVAGQTSSTPGPTALSLTNATAPAGTMYGAVVIASTPAQVGELDFELDAVMVAQAATLTSYGDGDTIGWEWLGSRGRAASAQLLAMTPDDDTSVLDGIFLDPLTANMAFNVYYSTDDSGPAATDHLVEHDWEQKLWTRVPQVYTATQRQQYVFPEPIKAKYIKVEFTNLQAKSYDPGGFQQPVVYKKFPTWVADFFIAQLESPSFVSSRVHVVNDALTFAYDYYLDDLHQEPAQPVSAPLSTIPNLSSYFTQSDASGIVDATTLNKINLVMRSFQLPQGALLNPDTSVMSQYAVETLALAEQQTPTTSESPLATQVNYGAVSSLTREPVIFEQSLPVMFFFLTCRHTYKELSATFEYNRAYFAGVNDIAFLRHNYETATDTGIYVESGGDTFNAEVNDFVVDTDNNWYVY